MDWKTINFDWNRARAFLVTAEEGSFSNAAKALGMTQSTLGRQVNALEEELGVILFERIGKGIEITPAGYELIDEVKKMGEAAARFSLLASGRESRLEGVVSISVSEATAVFILPKILPKLHEEMPGIKIQVISTDAPSDLRRREADIAIRNFQPTHSDLIAKKLSKTHAYLYCTKGYLEKVGPIESLEDTKKCDFFGFVENDRYLKVLQEMGLPLSDDNFPYSCSSFIPFWYLMKEGCGVAVGPKYLADAFRDFEIVLLSDLIPPFPVETWLVSHRELRTSGKIRYVFDFLEKEINQMAKSGLY